MDANHLAHEIDVHARQVARVIDAAALAGLLTDHTDPSGNLRAQAFECRRIAELAAAIGRRTVPEPPPPRERWLRMLSGAMGGRA